MIASHSHSARRRLLLARSLRGAIDGLVSVLLAAYLARLGFSTLQIGAIVTGTLLGSAALTMAAGLLSPRLSLRRVLLGASGLMVLTGVGFAAGGSFWLLLAIAVVGTLNPSSGDVSVFLPVEQALLARVTGAAERAGWFARYNLSGTGGAALGALFAGVPAQLAAMTGVAVLAAERGVFLVYAGVGVAMWAIYRSLPQASGEGGGGAPLAQSRSAVFRLAALFSLDSFGGGFAVQSLLVLWLQQRFGLSLAVLGPVFFASGLLSAASQLVSAKLVGGIGHVRTMVFTHLPANGFLILAGMAPTAEIAIGCLLARAAMSQMDVPARQAFVMSIVPAEERAAAASVTNVPRSLASAIAPLLAGLLLQHSTFGWPLICGGVIKSVYDLLLLAQFRDHAMADESE